MSRLPFAANLVSWLACLAPLAAPLSALGADAPASLRFDSPRERQVVQRTGDAPGAGYADVVVAGDWPQAPEESVWEARLTPPADAQNSPVEQSGEPSPAKWQPFTPRIAAGHFEGRVRVPAGGWHRLEVRLRHADTVIAHGTIEQLGVGEVFLIAGQSYATNCNDERLRVADAAERVVAFDTIRGEWQVANDPQPVVDGSHDGSIWPPLGDSLVAELRVPVGFVNVAVGATSSTQWQPGGELHRRLVDAGSRLGRFRAVLWQQGESDVIAKTTTEAYVANLDRIRESAVRAWGHEPPWLLAKSTLHPTVYQDPEGESRIRSAIDALVTRPGFHAGPDTDTLAGEHRGGPQSRRHFSAIGQRRAGELWHAAIRQEAIVDPASRSGLRVGLAETDITPPVGFPMAGYYHERLAEGALDPLKARALVLRDGDTAAALVVCDLIGIATDLSREVRRRASERTGIPADQIVLAATHSHTAPDYMKELYLQLGGEPQGEDRATYIAKLIDGPVEAIVRAHEEARPMSLAVGAATPSVPVSFCRRFVMRDGSVRTWQSLNNPEVVRAAAPIDPDIKVVALRDVADGRLRGVLSNFALHLDTVGGTRWSADYPHFIERSLRTAHGDDVLSLFATGCCGDINHVDPSTTERNSASRIGGVLGEAIRAQLPALAPLDDTRLRVRSTRVSLPLEAASREEVERSVKIVELARRGERVEFFDHVTAYKKLILDQLHHREPFADCKQQLTWGLSRSLAGVGETLPVDVTAIMLGHEVAIVCLPGEVFVELGLAIQHASPFRHTFVVELSNAVETIYIPHRAAYAGGGYEVTNSAVQPGSGEQLVEAALRLLRD